MAALVIAEHNHKQLCSTTHSTLAAARQLCEQTVVLVMGYRCREVAEQAACLAGVSQVWLVDEPSLQHLLAEPLAAIVADLAKTFAYVLAPASSFGKNFMPRGAALLDVEQISDVCAIVDSQTFKRPIYAGNAIATVQSSASLILMTIRTTCFTEGAGQLQSPVSIQQLAVAVSWANTEFVDFQAIMSQRPDLAEADIVVAGGRGFKSAENFKLLEHLADKLGAGVGATRAAVDAGYAPNDYQIGQTGRIIAPKLYIAIGISGAIQHLAGFQDSKIVVAINSDPDAPIFAIADYGLVGDLFELVPELEKALEEIS